MLKIENISFLSDIARLPKDTLQEICTNLDIPSDDSTYNLAKNIWRQIKGDPDRQRYTLNTCREKILCGKVTATWFLPDSIDLFKGSKQRIKENLGFNPFEIVNFPRDEKLTSTPVLFCGAQGNKETEYYLRFMYKSGVTSDVGVHDIDLRIKKSIATVFVSEDEGIVEVRADHRKSEEIVSILSDLVSPILGPKIYFLRNDFITNFENNAEKIADSLNGELIDTQTKPEFFVDEINVEEAQAIVSILTALDSYFEEANLNKLIEELKQASETFGDQFLGAPFTVLLLAGLGKVGMGGLQRDLRGTPLYDYLKPYLQHQGGYIRFQLKEDGLEKSYTIRVGFNSKSIYFIKPATEKVIKYVRERLTINPQLQSV